MEVLEAMQMLYTCNRSSGDPYGDMGLGKLQLPF